MPHNITRNWENPLIVEQNRLEPRPCAIFSGAHSNCQPNDKGARKNFPYIIALKGEWKFKLFDSPDEALATVFWEKELEYMSEMTVPGCWQLESNGDPPIYTNIKYPIGTSPPKVPERNPTGLYQKTFKIPRIWKRAKRTIVHFDGVDSAFYVWCDGSFVGYSTDSRLPAEFDLSRTLRREENGDDSHLLSVLVLRWSCGTFVEDQDHWHMSGIHRSVHLLYRPSHGVIENYHWSNEIELHELSPESLHAFAAKRATLRVNCDVVPFIVNFDLTASLYYEGIVSLEESAVSCDNLGDPVAVKVKNMQGTMLGADDEGCHVSVSLQLDVPQPKLWCAERPHLYRLVLNTRNHSDGSTIHSEWCWVGLRTIDIGGDGVLRLNGRRIVFSGINRHEHDDKKGYTVTRESMLADVLLLKRFNFNAVRTSHYPNDPYFYDLCDRAGLYVVDEANIETHGMKPYVGYLADHPDWAKVFTERIRRMMARDRCHPSIIMWSLGNESGYGAHHDACAALLRASDPTRPIMYEPATYGRESLHFATEQGTPLATDIMCPMYARPHELDAFLEMNDTMPLVLCEYSHAMGNSNGSLHKYWTRFRQNPRCQGGFIWDFIDQGIRIEKPNSTGDFGRAGRGPGGKIEAWGYGGDFDEPLNDEDFCINGLVWPDRTPHPAMHECKYLSQPLAVSRAGPPVVSNEADGPVLSVRVNLVSRYDHEPSALSALELSWEAVVGLASVKLTPPAWSRANEAQEATLQIPCAAADLDGADLVLVNVVARLKHSTNWAEKGHIVATEQLVLERSEFAEALPMKRLKAEQRGVEKGVRVAVDRDRLIAESASKGVRVEWSLETGKVVRAQSTKGADPVDLFYYNEGSDEALQTLAVQLHRAPTSNDRGGYASMWAAAGMLGPLRGPVDPSVSWTSDEAEGAVTVVSNFKLRPTNGNAKNCSLMQSIRSLSERGAVLRKNQKFPPNRPGEPLESAIYGGLSEEEAEFVRSLAGAYRLRHCSTEGKGGQSVEVAVPRFPCTTTHPLGEGLSVAPDAAEVAIKPIGKEQPVGDPSYDFGEVNCEMSYRFDGSGRLTVSCALSVPSHWPVLPRVGLRALLSPAFSDMCYEGRGPHENYPDRKSSAVLGSYSTTVDATFTPYIRPGECGARSDAMRVELIRPGGRLVATAEAPFVFSTHRLLAEDMDVRHPEDLKRRPFVVLSLDHLHMGVGGDDRFSFLLDLSEA